MSITINGTYYSKIGPRKYEAKYYISSDEKEPFLVFKFQGGATSFRNILIPAGVHFRYDTREILYEELFQEKDGKQAEYQEANVIVNTLKGNYPDGIQNMGIKDTMQLDFSETLEELSEEDKDLIDLWPTVSFDAVKQLDDSLKLALKANPIDLEQRLKDIGGQSQKTVELKAKLEKCKQEQKVVLDILWDACADLNKLYSSSCTPGDVLEILDMAEREQLATITVFEQKITPPSTMEQSSREKAVAILDVLKEVLAKISGWEITSDGSSIFLTSTV